MQASIMTDTFCTYIICVFMNNYCIYIYGFIARFLCEVCGVHVLVQIEVWSPVRQIPLTLDE